ncbi:MAG TPA: hypothetical protein VGR47_04550 [Terracidiphilus sp.]|nr:hypothetical protein [Terracidiphilus sp.]
MAISSLEAPSGPSQKTAIERWSYTGFALAMIAVSIVGFVPSLVSPEKRHAPLSLLAATHGLLFFAWQILFLTQSLLIATRRVSLHRRLDLTGVFLFIAMLALGSVTTVSMARRGFDLSGDLKILPQPTPGFIDPIAGMLFPLTDLTMFAVLGAAALAFRRRREIHRRLMLFASIILVPAPLQHLIGHNPTLAAVQAPIIMIPIGMFLFAAVARDFLVERRVHPLTWTLAITMFASGPLRAFVLGPSPAWHRFAAWLIR